VGTEALEAPNIHLFKRNILDSPGCAIALLSAEPFRALREQLEEYCTKYSAGSQVPLR
jgi:2-methylcitrate dehydratase